jgi:nucleolar pre-ribosomal-associated protein 1
MYVFTPEMCLTIRGSRCRRRYWSGAALTLEPRLSSKWIANICFFGTVISLPIPSTSFLFPNELLPSPPPLSTVLENILPSVNTKSHLSKGLQSNIGLVQHCTALSLIKCLRKFEDVMSCFEDVANALEEDLEDGQWYRRRREVEREVRRRVPDFQVVVAFSQHKWQTEPGSQPNFTKIGLLMESAQRLLWHYQKCLPEVVAEARFDVGKLLTNFLNAQEGSPDSDPESSVSGMDTIRKLHVLRLLRESDQFVWSGKIGMSCMNAFTILGLNNGPV